MSSMLHLLVSLMDSLVANSVKASILIALVLLLRRVFSPWLSARARYCLWLPVVLSLVLPPGFGVEVPVESVLQTPESWSSLVAPGGKALENAQLPGELAGEKAVSPAGIQVADAAAGMDAPTMKDVISLLWGLGVVVFIGSLLYQHSRFSRLIDTAEAADPRLQNLLNQWREQVGCHTSVTLLSSSAIATPLVAGWRKPKLLLPAGLETSLGEQQLRHVFLHELMHVKRADIAGNWALALVQCLHWFNPLVWIAMSNLRSDRELVRDAETLQWLQQGEQQDYGTTLLQLSQTGPATKAGILALGIAEGQQQLRRRLQMLMRSPQRSRMHAALGSGLLLMLGAVVFSKPVITESSSVQSASAAEMMVTTTPQAQALASATVSVAPPPAPIADATVLPSPVVASKPRVKRTVNQAPVQQVAVASAKVVAAEAGHADALPEAVEPQPAVVVAQAALAPEADSAVEREAVPAEAVDTAAIAVKPEIYKEWNAIQTLAMQAENGKAPMRKQLLEFVEKANECPLPLREAFMKRWSVRGCSGVAKVVNNGDVNKFWNKCEGFINRYNTLARNFASAKAEEFSDRAHVGKALSDTYRNLSEYCNSDVYKKQHPRMIELINVRNLSAIGEPKLSDASRWDYVSPNGAIVGAGGGF